jgi:hypothetical protein
LCAICVRQCERAHCDVGCRAREHAVQCRRRRARRAAAVACADAGCQRRCDRLHAPCVRVVTCALATGALLQSPPMSSSSPAPHATHADALVDTDHATHSNATTTALATTSTSSTSTSQPAIVDEVAHTIDFGDVYCNGGGPRGVVRAIEIRNLSDLSLPFKVRMRA